MLDNKKTKVFEIPWFFSGRGALLQESDLTEESKSENRHEGEEERHRRFFALRLFSGDFGTVLARGTSARSLHYGLVSHCLHRSFCFY